MNLLALTGSPRKNSFSTKLQNEFLNPFIKNGFNINIVNAYEADIKPCTACGRCASESRCIFDDAMSDIYNLIRNADIISISSPLYFSSFPAPLKSIIDRCQLLWEESKRTGIKSKEKKGFFFCTAGSDYNEIFTGVLTGMRHFYNTINTSFDINEAVLVKNCDLTEEISLDMLEKCRMLGIKYSDQ
ncbi:MAG TPA: flavodoxin family protein [Spirochaetota bacterium]|nr:flavodoxin family protein [Spirochaetota bacterium]HPS87455.1 flavodoxin family protein [Spirochaetota bacterium]